MSGPTIDQRDGVAGFRWLDEAGAPTTLAALVAGPDAEARRWLPTHLEALDDALVQLARGRGEVLGGARAPTPDEEAALLEGHRSVDRACLDYQRAVGATRSPVDLRAGQIVGSAVLLSIHARSVLGRMGPAPLDDVLDRPDTGVVGGHAGLEWASAAEPWQGARWVVRTEDGRRLPATLAMLLFDSSGVLTDAALDEHRAALRRTTSAVTRGVVEPVRASGAVDWLLYDFLMAHRDGPDSGAVELRPDRRDDPSMVLAAAAASVQVRSLFDPEVAA